MDIFDITGKAIAWIVLMIVAGRLWDLADHAIKFMDSGTAWFKRNMP